MPFTFNDNRLTEEQRKAIWSEGFPYGCINGFDIYFGELQRGNMLSKARGDDWWSGGCKYVPSNFIRQWLDSNYQEFEEDMRSLAEVMMLKRDDYFLSADYLTNLYHERGALIRSLVSAEYMIKHISQIYQGVTQAFAEEVGLLMMDPSWPDNLRQDLRDNNFDQDLEDFWQSLASHMDEFLGRAVRSYRGDLNPDDPPGDGGPAGDGQPGVSVMEFC